MNPRTEVRNARCCGVCSGRMWTIRRGVYGCMAGCWHCPCCGGHFRRGEGCPCRSCRICGEKALAGRACGNCGSPCPRSSASAEIAWAGKFKGIAPIFKKADFDTEPEGILPVLAAPLRVGDRKEVYGWAR